MAWTTSTLLFLTGTALALGVRDDRPLQTATAEDGFDLMGWTPMPTQMPAFVGSNELIKRATEDPPNPTCGYMLGLEEYSFTCYNDKYCGARTDYSVLGCCNTYYSTGGDYSLSGCTYQTTCYDSTRVAALSASELSNSRALLCTSAMYPYCMQYSFTDISYRIYGCNTGSNVVIDMALTVASDTPSSSITLKSTGVRPIQSATGTPTDDGGTVTDEGSNNNGTTSAVPTPKPNNTPAIVGGVVGGIALILFAAGACFFFYLKHKRQQRAAGMTPGGAPAMVQNQRPESGAGKAPETMVSPIGGQQNPPPQYYQPGPQPMMSPPPPQPMMTPPPPTGSPGPMLPPMAAMAPYHTGGNTAFTAPGPSPMMGMQDQSRPYSQVSPNLAPTSPVGVQEMPSRVASPMTMSSPGASEAPNQPLVPPSHASVSSISEAHGQPITPQPPQTYVYQAYNPNAPGSPPPQQQQPPVGQNNPGQNPMGYHAGPTPDWERHELA